jgi:hypothetical protein
MNEIDVYINLLTELDFIFQNEESSSRSENNILRFSGYICDRPYSASIWFNYKTDEISFIKVEDIHDNFSNPTYTKESFTELYKDKIREIKIKTLIDV